MSKIKNHYHDQICEGMRLAKENEQYDNGYHEYLADKANEYGIDAGPLPLSQEMINTISEAINKQHDIDYHGYLADRAKEYGIETGPLPLSPEMINTISEAIDRMIEEMAEKHTFFSIFEKTNTYPC